MDLRPGRSLGKDSEAEPVVDAEVVASLLLRGLPLRVTRGFAVEGTASSEASWRLGVRFGWSSASGSSLATRLDLGLRSFATSVLASFKAQVRQFLLRQLVGQCCQ